MAIGRLKFTSAECRRSENGLDMVLHVDRDSTYAARQIVQELKQRAGKTFSASVDVFRQKRSLDANAYMWVLLERISEAIHTDKDRVYIDMLKRYGQFTHICVKPEAVEAFKREWRAVRELGEVTINGKKAVQLQCYFGSSTYDTKEMSRLIDGIITECEDLGIDWEVDGYSRINHAG